MEPSGVVYCKPTDIRERLNFAKLASVTNRENASPRISFKTDSVNVESSPVVTLNQRD